MNKLEGSTFGAIALGQNEDAKNEMRTKRGRGEKKERRLVERKKKKKKAAVRRQQFSP